MLKKTLSVMLALILAFGVFSFAAFAADAPSPQAAADVNKAIEADLVPQSLQSNYSQPVTRAEFCALIVTLYENTKSVITERSVFTDTNDVNVEKLASLGIVNGVGENNFDPDANINREQAAVILSRLADAIGKPFAKASAAFSDNDDISPWAFEAAGQMQAAGIIGGADSSMFSPKGDCTREQCIIMVIYAFETIVIKHEGFTDYPVVIGEGTDYPLHGILSMPDNTADKVPAVVLVHGSGPQDMDETIYENKPFLDIAEYLASRGIAVIRYDKRTLVYGAELVQKYGGSLTVNEETVEDAVLAANLLKSNPRIDENKVFIIGHSLGGMLASRIHAEGGNFAGIILLAGSPRSLLDISYDQQMAYINEMPDSEEKTTALSQMEQYDVQVEALMSLSGDDAKNVPMPGGISFYYYKEMDEHPVSMYLKSITAPFIVLQGSKDFQVYADKDFIMWQELLEGRANVTFKLYEGLNHLFMASTGKNITEFQEEYKVPSHVDAQVLADIAEWIKTV